MMIRFDGHVHTPFCPHGSSDPFEAYIEKAIKLGLKGITFTEHAPLPLNFTDPVPEKDSAMKPEQMEAYVETLTQLKHKYKDQIAIYIGLEVDYIAGFEEETRHFLTTWGKFLDDAILSVHFLCFDGEYYCLDYSPEMFAQIVEKAGSLQTVYDTYYDTVKRSILSDLGPYKPKRIGHMTLVRKFQKRFPYEENNESDILQILDLIKEKDYELDYNSAGLMKPLCKEAYPSAWIVNEAVKRGIPLIYGSDAHSAEGVGQGFHQLFLKEKIQTPKML